MTTNRGSSRGRQSALKTAAASVIGMAVYSFFSEESYLHNGRRSLTTELEHEMDMNSPSSSLLAKPAHVAVADDESKDNVYARENLSYLTSSHSTLLPWAQNNLVDIHEGPAQTEATPIFWHIPKAGGTTAKQLYQVSIYWFAIFDRNLR